MRRSVARAKQRVSTGARIAPGTLRRGCNRFAAWPSQRGPLCSRLLRRPTGHQAAPNAVSVPGRDTSGWQAGRAGFARLVPDGLRPGAGRFCRLHGESVFPDAVRAPAGWREEQKEPSWARAGPGAGYGAGTAGLTANPAGALRVPRAGRALSAALRAVQPLIRQSAARTVAARVAECVPVQPAGRTAAWAGDWLPARGAKGGE